MPWIKVIEYDESEGRLREIYDKIISERGKLSNIMKIHSLIPESMEKHLDLYISIMFKAKKLRRWEAEMIGVYVSMLNKCPYCINHHAEALKHYWGEERVKKFLDSPHDAVDSTRERAMLEYAAKLTREPWMMDESDIEALRESGLSDEEILHLNLVTSYFNFVNRVVLGLGVEYTEDEVRGYKY